MSGSDTYPVKLRKEIQSEFGWKTWSENPWLTDKVFGSWVRTAPDSLLAAHAVNSTNGGRWYLSYTVINPLNISIWRHKASTDLVEALIYGLEAWHHIRQFGNFQFRFPENPLPRGFVDSLDSEYPNPFSAFWGFSTCVVRGRLALDAMNLENHPELSALIDHAVMGSLELKELYRELDPQMPLPTLSDERWHQMGMERTIKFLAGKYRDAFDSTEDSEAEGMAMLWQLILKEMDVRPEKLLETGLRNKLPNYLCTALNRDFIDKVLKRGAEQRQREKTQELMIERYPGDRDQSLSMPIDALYEIDTDALSLAISELPQAERNAIESAIKGFRKGFSPNSKQERSLKQWWGDDYERMSRAWRRAKGKIKNILAK